jgi:hypothetical protein
VAPTKNELGQEAEETTTLKCGHGGSSEWFLLLGIFGLRNEGRMRLRSDGLVLEKYSLRGRDAHLIDCVR